MVTYQNKKKNKNKLKENHYNVQKNKINSNKSEENIQQRMLW